MRICGKIIPDNKKVPYALCYLNGIGLATANKICDDLHINKDIRARDLTEENCKSIEDYIANNKIIVGDDVKSMVMSNIRRLIELKCYRGNRHKNRLAIKGNRRNNGKTFRRIGGAA